MNKNEVNGNTIGLKKSILLLLESFYDMKNDNILFCDIELATMLAEVTSITNREIAVFINNKGNVASVFVGDFKTVTFDKEIEKGCRCIHTHPAGNGMLSSPDLDTLKILPLKAMAAIGVANGKILNFYCAYMNEHNQAVMTNPLYSIEESSPLMDEINTFATDRRVIDYNDDERVIAVGLNTFKVKANLDELEELIVSAGGACVHKLQQNRDKIDNAFYIGKGKLGELKYLISEYDANTVCFDDPLSATQMRNIEQILNVKVLDRSALILDIFASRANSKEGKLQVELAQLNHLLPFLIGKHTQLSRLAGGIGTRGPGESKLETDKRHILHKIDILKKQLKEVENRRSKLRDGRKDKDLFIVSLAGYTNAGKSTLLNKLTDSDVFEKDMLFATLDPSIRRLQVSASLVILFVDTVGFISKLPHELIEAFKSTLEEVVQSDLILHVMDGSNEFMEDQASVVYGILDEIKADKVKVIEVVNKIDLMSGEFVNEQNKVYVSSKTGEGIPYLLKEIEELASDKKEISIKVTYKNGKLISYIHDHCEIIKEQYEADYTLYTIRATQKIINKILTMNEKV